MIWYDARCLTHYARKQSAKRFLQSFYYNNGPGSPVAAAQGKGYLDEFIARFTGQYPQANSALNETFDNSSTYFPLNQSIYADATHEVVVLDTLTAFNLTALFQGPPLSPKGNRGQNSFVASQVVPFATHFTTQVLSCPAYQPTKQIRFIVYVTSLRLFHKIYTIARRSLTCLQ